MTLPLRETSAATGRGPWTWIAVVVLGLLAVSKIGDELGRLVLDPSVHGAVDLRRFHNLVHRWFSGEDVYGSMAVAVYPPATPVFLWPLLGWLSKDAARWLWAATTLAALVWFVQQARRATAPRDGLELALLALLPLSLNATGVAIGNGQLGLHTLPLVVAAFLLLRREPVRWYRDLLAGGLMAVALVKPSLTAPFALGLAFLPGRFRPALCCLAVYGAATLSALSLQVEGAGQLAAESIHYGIKGASIGAGIGGYANLHSWGNQLGLGNWDSSLQRGVLAAGSLVCLGLAALWTYRHRRADVWIHLGVLALVARFWVYHRAYDNVLIALPMIALWRAWRAPDTSVGERRFVLGLLVALVVAMVLPARLQRAPLPWSLTYSVGHPLLWLAVLGYLMRLARTHRVPAAATAEAPASA